MTRNGSWIVHDPDELESLRAGWNGLVPLDSPPTEWFSWTRLAAGAFHPRRQLAVVGVGPPSRPRALAPLVRDGLFRPYWQIGSAELMEPADLPHADPAAAGELAEALVATRLPIMLRRMPTRSTMLRALRSAASVTTMVHVRHDHGTPVLALDESWIDPLPQLSSSRRQALRRARRRAAEIGDVTFESLRPGPADLAAMLEEALAVEDRGWKGRSGTALDRNDQGPFFRAWTQEMSVAGVLRIGFLRIAGRAVAMQIAVEASGNHWIFKIGYDTAVAHCSPGNLLTAEMIADAARRGLTRYEFLGWPAPWITAWTKAERPLSAVALTPARPDTVAAFAPEALRRVRRRGQAVGAPILRRAASALRAVRAPRE